MKRTALAPLWILALLLAMIVPAASAGPDSDEAEAPGFLGVMLQRVDGGLAEALDMKDDEGVLLGQVVEDGPAAAAGLESGDIVVKIDGEDVSTPNDLRTLVRGLAPGTTVRVDYLRDGDRAHTDVTLGEAPSRGKKMKRIMKSPRHLVKELRLGRERGYLGVVPQDLSEQLGDFFGVKDGEGVLVSEVVEDSPAETLGLKAGDVIIRVGDEDVESAGDLHDLMRGFEEPTEVEVAWIRDGKEKDGSVELEIRESRTPRVFSWRSDDDEVIDIDVDVHDFDGSGLQGLNLDRHSDWLRHHVGDGSREIRRIEIHEGANEELEELRGELKELREELDELRKELKD